MQGMEGLECRRIVEVEERHLAEHLLEKGVEAVSTPSLLYFAESTVRACLEDKLSPEGLTTVGVWASIKHLRRAPKGARLAVRGRILSHAGRRLTAYITITRGEELIAEVFHERRIVDINQLLANS